MGQRRDRNETERNGTEFGYCIRSSSINGGWNFERGVAMRVPNSFLFCWNMLLWSDLKIFIVEGFSERLR